MAGAKRRDGARRLTFKVELPEHGQTLTFPCIVVPEDVQQLTNDLSLARQADWTIVIIQKERQSAQVMYPGQGPIFYPRCGLRGASRRVCARKTVAIVRGS